MNTSVENPKDTLQEFGLFSTLIPKNITAFIKFLSNDNSVEYIKKTLADYQAKKHELPIKEEDIKPEELKDFVKKSDSDLMALNDFLAFIDQDPGINNGSFANNPKALASIDMLKELRETMADISEYSKLVLGIQETKTNLETKGKTYNCDEFMAVLEAA